MAELATLARPYANAVFDIAKRTGELDRWSRMLAFLVAAARDPRVKTLLESPEVDERTKGFRLAEVCGEELNDRARKFVGVLAANKRLPVLAEIQEQFELRRAEEQHTLDVEVTSAYPLSDAESSGLSKSLHRRFGKEINMTSRVDATLLGGAVIRAGDTVIDGSVRGKLHRLAESLQRT